MSKCRRANPPDVTPGDVVHVAFNEHSYEGVIIHQEPGMMLTLYRMTTGWDTHSWHTQMNGIWCPGPIHDGSPCDV